MSKLKKLQSVFISSKDKNYNEGKMYNDLKGIHSFLKEKEDILDAPDSDNNTYGIKNGSWSKIEDGSDRFVEKEGDTMTGPLTVEIENIINGVIVTDVMSGDTGVEYVSGTIPPAGDYTNGGNGIPIKATGGSGLDATFFIQVKSGVVGIGALKIESGNPVHNGGKDFNIGDEILLSGQYLGGIDGTDDMMCVVTEVESIPLPATITTIGETFETNAVSTFNESASFKKDLNVEVLSFTPSSEGTTLEFGLFGSTYQQNISNPNNNKSINISSTEFGHEMISLSGEDINYAISINYYGLFLSDNSNGNVSFQSDLLFLQKNSNVIVLSENSIKFDFIDAGTLKLVFKKLPVFNDNASAVSGGLAVDTVYKTSTGELRIVV